MIVFFHIVTPVPLWLCSENFKEFFRFFNQSVSTSNLLTSVTEKVLNTSHSIYNMLPVIDSKSSGEILTESVYSNGVAQYIQIKNQVRLEPESNYAAGISNQGYVKKYTKLVGLTGTVGKAEEQIMTGGDDGAVFPLEALNE